MSEPNENAPQTQVGEHDAERILLEPKDLKITIGDRDVPVLPLNLYGAKAILTLIGKIIGPLRAANRAYGEARQAYYEARADNKPATAPDEQWWLPVVLQNIDDVYGVLFVILSRGDGGLTISYLQDNLAVIRDLNALWPMLLEANDIGVILKKALASELGQKLAQYGISRIRSGSPASSETSPGTTESASMTSPTDAPDTPSPSASSSETESPATSDS